MFWESKTLAIMCCCIYTFIVDTSGIDGGIKVKEGREREGYYVSQILDVHSRWMGVVAYGISILDLATFGAADWLQVWATKGR